MRDGTDADKKGEDFVHATLAMSLQNRRGISLE